MVESCIWKDLKCQIELIPQKCEGLNKFGCLNFQQLTCVWSDTLLKCELAKFLDKPESCIQFLINQSEISHMNAQTCTQINVNKSCILAQTYKCREIQEPQLYQCETQGLNYNACLLKTKNSCAFKNYKCITIQNVNEGCKDYLNEVACLMQNAICKFNKEVCSDFKFNSIYDIIDNKFAPYSIKVCLIFNEEIGLIYSVIQKRCLKVDNLNRILTDCTQFGINKYTCLNKVESFCEFKDNKCQHINPSDITLCLNTLNQFACTQSSNVLCKFQNNQCNVFSETNDFNCALQQSKQLSNPKICYADQKNPCFFNGKTRQCQLVEEKSIQIECNGLNRKACIFNSQELVCLYNETDKKCEGSYGYSKCSDLVNKNKCLSIITKGQSCQFNDTEGCQYLDKSVDIFKCEKQIQTNPYTCSQSLDVPCFYDKQTKMCIQYKTLENLNSINNSSIISNYQLSNIDSFNKQTCEQFQKEIFLQDSQLIYKDVLIFWKESCIQIQSAQLFQLQCDQNLNLNACINIKTQFQYCQYINNKCINVDLKDYINTPCESIKNINSGAICAQTLDVACYFDPFTFSCKSLKIDSSDIQQIQCVDKNPEQKGYNKQACSLDQNNCIFKEQCYKINKTIIQFCEDATDIIQCQKVQREGCQFQQNRCIKIQFSDYYSLPCELAINRQGCINIQTKGLYCQYLEEKCMSRDLMDIRQIECLEVKNINHYSFCEYPQDEGCVYDFQSQSCQIVSSMEDLICQRGINRIACLKQTNSQLNCQFIDYCYDPNYGIQKCTNPNKSLCCREAGSIENCLNQQLYKCQWNNNECQNYLDSQNSRCDDIKFSSLLTCISIQDNFCIYDSINHICKSIEPTSCDQLQSPSQCSRILTLPCIWYEEEQQCMYLETQDDKNGYISMGSSAQMNCEDITYQNGSQRACMNIERQGQMCIYKDNKCAAFEQDETQNNCLDNININSCLQQKISDCYWNIQLVKVKKTIQNNESEEKYGNCIKFVQYESSGCDSKLSYTSCLKIIKEGINCRWKNQQCQTIDDKELIIFQPSYLFEVNVNACGLINNGDIVKYDKNMRFCIKVDDVQTLSCQTEGLNKEACLNIKFQNCFWDPTRRKCRHQQLLIDEKLNSCKLQNLSSYLCSQLKLDLPCGFMKDGCDFVDLDQVKCTYEGLNKYACLNIKKYPCIWLKNSNNENFHCEDYLQYLPCDQIPSNVNSKVCSIVKNGACYYDQQNLKCEIPNEDQKSCSLTGLNIIGCVKIENCFFDQNCQLLNKQQYICEEFPIANKLICKNAVDSCKYNEFQYGCSHAFDEFCSNDSLSEQGCLSQPNCVLQAQRCQCRKFVEIYDCTEIQEMDKCKLKSHCKVQQQENKQSLQCILKQCQDYSSDECDGKSILKSICYWSSSNECLSAQKCDDIVKPIFQCSQYEFNDRPCQMSKNSENCEQFNCENFSKEQCQKYKQFCNFDQTCQKNQCNQYLIMESCIINNCHWNSKENTCSEQIHCSKIYDEIECNKYKYNSRPCQWIVNEDIKYCTQYRCSDLDKSQQCSGSRIESEVCVEISDSICISCEEIFDSCDCLQQSKYCSYDIKKDKCASKNCESYLTKEECPINYCTFIEQKCQIQCQFRYNYDSCNDMNYQCEWREENQKCQPKCEYIFDEEMCSQVDQCSWNYQEDKCQNNEPIIILNPLGYGEIIITGLITLCISLM
ncbi:unnamed protein product [Paramecium pentaurelia]|uniref:Uncharacterized protein n=1 Tax=Paramecium pentaurelia TaxID=43138 RepID=A0A8S1SNP8_9CILI|nr:unnamed protein product [Paramecium pentaurelia]